MVYWEVIRGPVYNDGPGVTDVVQALECDVSWLLSEELNDLGSAKARVRLLDVLSLRIPVPGGTPW